MQTTAVLARDELQSKIEATLAPAEGMVRVMANDSFLRETISDTENLGNKDKILKYLDKYTSQYKLMHAYVISELTGNYYNSGSQTGQFENDSQESIWVDDFIKNSAQSKTYIEPSIYNGKYQIVAAHKIIDDEKVLGIVGVRTEGEEFFKLFKEYYDKYKVKCSIVDKTGRIVFSYAATPDRTDDLFGSTKNIQYKNKVLTSEGETGFWYPEDIATGFVASHYMPKIDMYLVAETSAFSFSMHFDSTMIFAFLAIFIIAVLVLVATSAIFRRYNSFLVKEKVNQEMEYQKLLQNTTESMYENVFEYDITHNCASTEKTRDYFNKLGLEKNATYTQMLEVIANDEIKPEFRARYIEAFNIDNILEKFDNDINTISLDTMLKSRGENYRWVRVTARTFYWTSDQSVRMISYREDINEQKCREKDLQFLASCDSMTKLYNKFATQEMIKSIFDADITCPHVLILCDIDNFKDVNDKFGHTCGDKVIIDFANLLKESFTSEDVIGRVGGDEFAVLIKDFKNIAKLNITLEDLCNKLSHLQIGDNENIFASASLGAAVFPQYGISFEELYEKADEALYFAKAHGKNSYHIYSNEIMGDISSHVSQRDMVTLIENASDGISKIAYLYDGFKILYFNKKRIQMVGMTAEEMSAEGYDVLSQFEPVSRALVYEEFMRCFPDRKMFSFRGKIVHKDGRLLDINVRGVFVNELYEGKYPVFYDMFTIL